MTGPRVGTYNHVVPIYGARIEGYRSSSRDRTRPRRRHAPSDPGLSRARLLLQYVLSDGSCVRKSLVLACITCLILQAPRANMLRLFVLLAFATPLQALAPIGHPRCHTRPCAVRTLRCCPPLLNAVDYGDTIFGVQRKVVQPLALLLAAQLVLFIGVGAVIPVLPLYGKEIGLSGALSGVVLSAPAVALLFGAQPAGRFADRARKPAMLWGMAVIALSDLGTAASVGLGPLVVARLGLGAGRSISESGERGMLADLMGRAPSLRGRALAAQQAVSALGIAIGAPLGGLVVDTYGARAAFLCVTAAATATFCVYWLLPETVPPAAKAAEDAAEPADRFARWREQLEDPRWRALALCEGGARFGLAAKIASIPVLAASVFSGGATSAGLLVSAAGLSGLIGAPVGGWLIDWVGARSVAMISGMVSGVGLMLIPLALSQPADGLVASSAAFAGLVLVWSVGAAAQAPALTAVGQELAPSGAEAESLALPRAAGDSVYIVAPLLLGTVADAVPVQGLECAVAGGATLLGALVLASCGPADASRGGAESAGGSTSQ